MSELITTSGAQPEILIEPREFARRGQHRQGVLSPAALPRLAEMLVDQQGVVEWRASGSLESDVLPGQLPGGGACLLTLQLKGSIKLQCQRCMEPMEFPFAFENRLLMVPEGHPLPEDELEEDSFDAIVVSDVLDLLQLIEDELLLSLPTVPRHEHCAPPKPIANEGEGSPFALLAQFKRPH